VRTLTAAWDAARPTEGAYAALLTFADGAFASLAYSGYGRFDSDEFDNWIGEMGQAKQPYAGAARPRFASNAEELAYKAARNYGGTDYRPAAGATAHQHFGTIIVSCGEADLRPVPSGVMIYQNGAARLEPLPPPTVPRAEVIDEIYRAVVDGVPPLHDGPWGTATVEVLLGMLRSAREGRDIALTRQLAAP
jgi:phthalate 4,5-cis-dihydrodiol dehydrogenase